MGKGPTWYGMVWEKVPPGMVWYGIVWYHLVGGKIPLWVVHILARFHCLRGVDAANIFISFLPLLSFISIFLQS